MDEKLAEGRWGDQVLTAMAILYRWKRFLIINFFAILVVTVIISLLLPKWYKATASVLPPKDQNLLNLLGGANSVLRGLTALPRLGGFTTPAGTYNYFAILKSRSAMEDVVRHFNLMSVYDIRDTSMDKAIKQLRENVEFESQDDDYITIDVYDKDPQRASDMANYFVSVLNTMSIELGTQEARANKEFIGERIAMARDSLRRAEETLKTFQEHSDFLITPEEASSISAAAEIYAMKTKKEIEIAILERQVSPDNEVLRQKQIELKEIQRKLAGFPETGLETIRHYREVITQQKILEILVPVYEQAAINEQKDVPVLLVLDKAVPPDQKIRPQRMLIVVIVSLLSILTLIAGVYMLHGLVRNNLQRNPMETRFTAFANAVARVYRISVT